MSARELKLVVAGTDTNVGKTVVSAALAAALGAAYWKPIQAGLDGETDADVVRRLGRLPPDRIIRSVHALALAASPHSAARREGVEIRQRQLAIPDVAGPLVIETAGGLMVPLSMRLLQIDLLAAWQLPVVLVARTALGTINHSLLSLEALRRRRVPVQGIAFVGSPQPEAEATIVALGRVRRLGRLPRIRRLDADKLAAAFAKNFEIGAFVE